MITFFYNVLDWSYRRLVTIVTILYTVLIISLAVTGFLISQILLPLLIGLWIIFFATTLYSKKKAEAGVGWTLRGMWQQFKNWRYGRSARARVKEKREYEGHFRIQD